MAARIRIDVVQEFGEGQPSLTVACYFDALDPVPVKAHGAYLAAISADDPAARAAWREAVAALFDAACREARIDDQPTPFDVIGFAVKDAATAKLIEIWKASVKTQGQ